MKKIWITSAVLATVLYANELSIDEELENQKVETVKKSNGMMPSISLIVDMGYTTRNFDNENTTEHIEIPGLVHGGGDEHEGHSHTSLAGDDGFTLNYAELSLGASIDNYFDLKGIFHITQDAIEIEEAYATTTSLPWNLRGRVGKFNSNFGYLNEKHHHSYSFNDIPLIYNALLGGHGLNDIGVQLQYVLPFNTYTMVGLEVLEGTNEQSFGVDGFSPTDANETFAGVEGTDTPLVVGYIKTSFDIAGGTLLAGASVANGKSRIAHLDEGDESHAFAGDSTIYGVDMTYKNYFSTHNSITLQGEYLYRELDGKQYVPNTTNDAWKSIVNLNKKQAGFYTQVVYRHNKEIAMGVRYSAIVQNDVLANGVNKNISDDIYVASAMVEYNFSEFSRVRLQYTHNSSLFNEDGTKNNKDEIGLQFNYAIGAHGAHSF